jgi:lysophospholipase L1-like esterase
MIQANAANSQLLDHLAKDFTNITLIETHPHLDGDPNQFIDLVHFNHQGELQMAENVFAGIKPVLQKALAQHSPAIGPP